MTLACDTGLAVAPPTSTKRQVGRVRGGTRWCTPFSPLAPAIQLHATAGNAETRQRYAREIYGAFVRRMRVQPG